MLLPVFILPTTEHFPLHEARQIAFFSGADSQGHPVAIPSLARPPAEVALPDLIDLRLLIVGDAAGSYLLGVHEQSWPQAPERYVDISTPGAGCWFYLLAQYCLPSGVGVRVHLFGLPLPQSPVDLLTACAAHADGLLITINSDLAGGFVTPLQYLALALTSRRRRIPVGLCGPEEALQAWRFAGGIPPHIVLPAEPTSVLPTLDALTQEMLSQVMSP